MLPYKEPNPQYFIKINNTNIDLRNTIFAAHFVINLNTVLCCRQNNTIAVFTQTHFVLNFTQFFYSVY